MIVMKQPRGKIIIAPDLNVWPHEYETAKSLAMAGMTVEFIRRSEEYRTTSADVIIDGAAWEIKAPKAINPKAIERNLRKASHQAANHHLRFPAHEGCFRWDHRTRAEERLREGQSDQASDLCEP